MRNSTYKTAIPEGETPRIAANMTQLIGNTPLVRLGKIAPHANIIGKCEFMNPNGSSKDRTSLAMIEMAEQKGSLRAGMHIIEPTSGNTGIGLAGVAAAKGYAFTAVMPDTMSQERRILLRALGAKLVLTSGEQGMPGAIAMAEAITAANPERFYLPQQFTNCANPLSHREHTAQEIYRDTAGQVDFVVSCVGTGGAITGIGEGLKARKPGVKIVAVEPETMAVLQGRPCCGSHRIQGIGTGFIPAILNMGILDEAISVTDEDAATMTRRLAREEGLLCGISSGAALWVALQLADRRETAGKMIVVMLPDTGERYLSTPLFDAGSND